MIPNLIALLRDTLPLLDCYGTHVGLDLGEPNPGDIINRSFNGFAGLQILPANTITLIGGNLSFPGGVIDGTEGRIELGAVAANNFVSLSLDELGWKPNYQEVEDFQDISFSQAFVFSFSQAASTVNFGDITIQGRNISLTEGTQIASIDSSF